MIGLTHDEMIALKPCANNSKKVTKLLGGAKAWNGKKITAAEAVAAGISFDDLVWVASAVARTDKDVERRLRLWVADCAARVLHVYEKEVPRRVPRCRCCSGSRCVRSQDRRGRRQGRFQRAVPRSGRRFGRQEGGRRAHKSAVQGRDGQSGRAARTAGRGERRSRLAD